jgi:peptidylprolyl isomerase
VLQRAELSSAVYRYASRPPFYNGDLTMRLRRLLVPIAAIGLLVTACGSTTDTTTTTIVEEALTDATGSLIAQDGDVVEVHYVGTLDDGSVFDSSRERGAPFPFTVGAAGVIAGFDQAVRGMGVGEVNSARMEAAEAYGEWSEDNVIEVPFNPEQGDVKAGDAVTLTNGQPATVLEVTAEVVKLDANHPLAGEALTFEIEVLSITRP